MGEKEKEARRLDSNMEEGKKEIDQGVRDESIPKFPFSTTRATKTGEMKGKRRRWKWRRWVQESGGVQVRTGTTDTLLLSSSLGINCTSARFPSSCFLWRREMTSWREERMRGWETGNSSCLFSLSGHSPMFLSQLPRRLLFEGKSRCSHHFSYAS